MHTTKYYEVNVNPDHRLRPRWWCGGIAGACAQLFVAPFDLMETRMQVLREEIGMIEGFKTSIKKQGFLSLYDGISAAFIRQLTYTTLRFHLYERGKKYVNEVDFMPKVFVACFAGIAAGVIGIPMDMVNTRMQIDRALKGKHQRRYKNVFNGMYRVIREEGFLALYKGCLYACIRASCVTVGQNAVYDQAKLFYKTYFELSDDRKVLHFVSSITAGLVCAPLLQPLDVLKTVNMFADTKLLKGWRDQFKFATRFGYRGLFRGIVPGMIRLVPSTIILFLVYEQLTLNFGYYDDE